MESSELGKFAGLVLLILSVWGSLAQIAPDMFQMRQNSKIMSVLWGAKTIWLTVMLSGLVAAIYIWTLENRLTAMSAVNSVVEVDKTRLRFVSWAPSETHCSAVVDASNLSNAFREKYDIALICGFHDPAVDRFKDDRITISPLFTPQNSIP